MGSQRRGSAGHARPGPELVRTPGARESAAGSCNEQEYLALPGNGRVELVDGAVRVLPPPTDVHQATAAFLFASLHVFVAAHELGKVRMAPLRLRLGPGSFRVPDVMYLGRDREHLRGVQYWGGADLVMEVVSDDERERAIAARREEYARAGVDEHWTIDVREQRIVVLRRDGQHYVEHGTFARGQQAASVCLPGFTIAVCDVFGAA